MLIRRFKENDSEAVSSLIRKTISISNKKDYPEDLMDQLIETETSEHVLQRASWTHFYVAVEADTIIGCGAIGPYWGREDESSLFTIFVLPEYQKKGYGVKILEEAVELSRKNGKKAVRFDALKSNIPAQKMYERYGFKFRGIQKLYYENTGWADFLFYEMNIYNGA